MSTNDGGQAFPTPRYERGDMYSLGMSLRDAFALAALEGGALFAKASMNAPCAGRAACPWSCGCSNGTVWGFSCQYRWKSTSGAA